MGEVWHGLGALDALAVDERLTACVGGWHVLVFRDAAGVHAVNDRCTHQAALLSPGRVRRGTVMCPLHGARFELATGKCLGGTYGDLRTFPVRISDGTIEVAVPDEPPGMTELPIMTHGR